MISHSPDSLEWIVDQWPDLMFWYHIPIKDLPSIPRFVIYKLMNELPRLKHEMIRQMVLAAQFPMISDEDVRDEIWDWLNDKPILTREERIMLPGRILPQEQFFPTIEGIGFAVERTHVEGGMKWPPDDAPPDSEDLVE